jgi:hypothetical protein
MANDTYWAGGQTRKLYKTSGEFTSTLKNSLYVQATENGINGINWDNADVWAIGRSDGVAMQWSGDMTSTLKQTFDVESVDINANGISIDDTDWMWTADQKNYLQYMSGKFTGTVKASLDVFTDDWSQSDIEMQFNGDTLWVGQQYSILWLQSGMITSTVKQTMDLISYDIQMQGLGWTGKNILVCGHTADHLWKFSGQFTTTLLDSVDTVLEDSAPRGIGTTNYTGRMFGLNEAYFDLPSFTVLGYTGAISSITMPMFTAIGQTGFNADGSLILPMLTAEGESFNRATASLTLSLLVQAIQGADQNCDADLTLPYFLHDFAGHEVIDIEVTFPALGGVEIGAAFMVGRAYTGTPPKCLAMNTKNFAVSEYKDFAFNSMTRFNGSDIVAGQNGIYELDDTDTDDTDVDSYKIKCHIKTGMVDTYERVITRMRDAYLTYRGEDDMELSVLADKSSNRHYTIENNYSNDNLIKIKRIKFERGIKNRHFDFKIANIVGGAMEIEKLKIALEPILSKRR